MRIRNRAESFFKIKADKNGWKYTKKGWPDFIAERNGEIIFVEVKKDKKHKLKKEQEFVAMVLTRLGGKVYKWTPNG